MLDKHENHTFSNTCSECMKEDRMASGEEQEKYQEAGDNDEIPTEDLLSESTAD